MTSFPRRYIYGINSDNSSIFLTTVLDKKDAEKFIQEHQKLFSGRFDEYIHKTIAEEVED